MVTPVLTRRRRVPVGLPVATLVTRSATSLVKFLAVRVVEVGNSAPIRRFAGPTFDTT